MIQRQSSEVETELVSHKLPFSMESKEYADVGLFKYQYMMLAVRVSIIFWFTWQIETKYNTDVIVMTSQEKLGPVMWDTLRLSGWTRMIV
jgi:hypothetical protein